MNCIEFILSLKDTNSHYHYINEDFHYFITGFNEREYNQVWKDIFHLSYQDFFNQLELDFQTCNPETKRNLIDLLKPYKNLNNSFLLQKLYEIIAKYLLQNPKFYEKSDEFILIKGFMKEFQENLYWNVTTTIENICISYKDAKLQKEEYTQAAVKRYYQMKCHQVYYYEDAKDDEESNTKEEMIFKTLRTLFHEKYHCLAYEVERNQACFKLDMLRKMKVDLLHSYWDEDINLSPLFPNGEKFYRTTYFINKEEKCAEEYGTEQAIRLIFQINPTFSFQEILNHLEKKRFQFEYAKMKNTFYQEKTFMNEPHRYDKLIDEMFDRFIKIYPSLIEGMLWKVYDKDGNKKEIPILLQEKELFLKEYPEIPREEIHAFYNALIYDVLKEKPLEELTSFLQDETMAIEISKCLQGIYESILKQEEELKQLHFGFHIGYIMEKMVSKNYLKDDLKELETLYNQLKPLLEKSRKGEDYGL